MLIRNLLFTFVCLILMGATSFGQAISTSGNFGYSNPQGDAFTNEVTGEKLSSFGLGYSVDILYLLESFENKLGLGVEYTGNTLFREDSDNFLNVGVYGLSLYAVKGYYRLNSNDRNFSPYGGLSIGLTRFSTPDITINGDTVEGESAFSFGIQPQLGIQFHNLLLSASYLVPMKYTVDSDTGDFEGNAGALSFTLGYRYYFDGSL